MKFAWIENEKIRDIAPGTPAEFYRPEIAAFYDTQVPDNAENGDGWVSGELVKPEPPAPPAPAPRQWDEASFRAGLTLAEKAKWDSNTTPEIVTVKQELPKDQAGATELLDFLVGAGVISQESADRILA